MNITKRKARSKLLVDESFHAKKLKTNISCTDTARELSIQEESHLIQNRRDKCLKHDFFDTDALSLSRNLLGTFLHALFSTRNNF